MRGLLSGIIVPLAGPFTIGVFAAYTPVIVPPVDSANRTGQCFSATYSKEVKFERVKEVAKSGAIGTGMGALLYFFILLAVVSAGMGGLGGMRFPE